MCIDVQARPVVSYHGSIDIEGVFLIAGVCDDTVMRAVCSNDGVTIGRLRVAHVAHQYR